MVEALFDKNTFGRDNTGETSVHKCEINYCRRLPRGWMVKVVSGTKTMGRDNMGKLRWYNFRCCMLRLLTRGWMVLCSGIF